MDKFISMGVSEGITNTLKSYGITVPTPIQEQAIPLLMEGKDVVAQAQTGTGKTFAFVLPIIEKIDPKKSSVQALIVTPTRELALQITNEIKKLIVDLPGINILAVYGGQDVESQLKKLKKDIHIVIGTPGRLLDHIRRETVDFSNVSFLVLDEADQMLHIGFLPDVEEIIKETPAFRQTMLFSATMPDEIRKLARRHLQTPVNIQVEKTQAPLANIKQIAISTVDRAKQNNLIQSLNLYRPFLAVIFCRTKRRVSKLFDALKAEGFNCDELHGDLSQAKRERVMQRFRDAELQFLIATDVAARGLDVEGVTHVFNYDVPLDTESYIHRIGRTGRAGTEGLAVTFYAPKDRPLLEMIEKDLNLRIDKKNLGNARENDSSDKVGTETQKGRGHQGRNRQDRSKKQSGATPRKGSLRNDREKDNRPERTSKERDGKSATKDRRNPQGSNGTQNNKGESRKPAGKQGISGGRQENRGRKQETRVGSQESRGRKQETRVGRQETRGRKQESHAGSQEGRERKQETRGGRPSGGGRSNSRNGRNR